MSDFKVGDEVYYFYLPSHNCIEGYLIGNISNITIRKSIIEEIKHCEGVVIGDAVLPSFDLVFFAYVSCPSDYLYKSKQECIDAYIKKLEALENE